MRLSLTPERFSPTGFLLLPASEKRFLFLPFGLFLRLPLYILPVMCCGIKTAAHYAGYFADTKTQHDSDNYSSQRKTGKGRKDQNRNCETQTA